MTAKELGFKHGVGDILAHVGQVLDFGKPDQTALVVSTSHGPPHAYPGHAFVVTSCHLEFCSGGVQRTYYCRMVDPGMITNIPQVFYEHELIPWDEAVATVRARHKDENKSD